MEHSEELLLLDGVQPQGRSKGTRCPSFGAGITIMTSTIGAGVLSVRTSQQHTDLWI
jgi:hypothetical protein